MVTTSFFWESLPAHVRGSLLSQSTVACHHVILANVEMHTGLCRSAPPWSLTLYFYLHVLEGLWLNVNLLLLKIPPYHPSLTSVPGGLQKPEQLQQPGHHQAWRGDSAATVIPGPDTASEQQDQDPAAARCLQLQQVAVSIFLHEDTSHSKALSKEKWWSLVALRVLGTRETVETE